MTFPTGPDVRPSSRLAGRTAVVTGSTSGIGAATARALASQGASVVVSGRDRDRGDAVVGEIAERGGRVVFVRADLAGSYDELRRFAAEAAAAPS